MSTQNLSQKLSTILYDHFKSEKKKLGITTRNELQARKASFLITEDQLRKGSKIQLAGGRKKHNINKVTAKMIMKELRVSLLPGFPSFDKKDIPSAFKVLSSKIKKANKSGRYAQKYDETTDSGIFKLIYTTKQSKGKLSGKDAINFRKSTKIDIKIMKVGYILVDKGFLFVGTSYGVIQEQVANKISHIIMDNFKSDTRTGKKIRDSYGRQNKGEDAGTEALTQIGHLDLEGTYSRTVQAEKVDITLKKISGSAKLLGGIGGDFIFTPDLQKQVADALRIKAADKLTQLSVKYNSSFIKKVNIGSRLSASLNVLLHVIQSKTLNDVILGGIGGLEAKEGRLVLNQESINEVITKIIRNNPADWVTSPSFLSSITNNFKDKFFKSIKKISTKIFNVEVPKTKRAKDSKTIVSGSIPVPITVSIREETTEIRKKSQEFGVVLDIVMPEVEEESCMLPAGKLLAIKGRLQYEMHNAIKANMHLPALVYRTGRFAKSVKIAGVKQNSDCSITAYYRYRVAPYAVFDPSISSYKGLSSPTRNPQKIIGDSIRDIARSVMKDRYTIRPQWV